MGFFKLLAVSHLVSYYPTPYPPLSSIIQMMFFVYYCTSSANVPVSHLSFCLSAQPIHVFTYLGARLWANLNEDSQSLNIGFEQHSDVRCLWTLINDLVHEQNAFSLILLENVGMQHRYFLNIECDLAVPSVCWHVHWSIRYG